MDLVKYIEAPSAAMRRDVAQSAEQVGRVVGRHDRREERRSGRDVELRLQDEGAGRVARKNVPAPEALNEPSREQRLDQALDQTREALQAHGVELRFKVREDAEGVQVEVRDPETDKVIRKIPADELVRLASHLRDFSGEMAEKALTDSEVTFGGALMNRPV